MDICGGTQLYLPSTECDECEAFLSRLTTVENNVSILWDDVQNKQDELTAGDNISIINNVISSTGGGSTYTAGDGITILNDVISALRNPTNTYTKAEVDELISGVAGLRMEVVTTLPTTGENGVIYLIERAGGGYEQWVYTQTDGWIDLGGEDIDLSGYLKTVDAERDYQKKLTAGTNVQINASNVITATDTTYSAGTGITISGANNAISVNEATSAPLMDGTAAVGTATKYAKEDHVHPTDTTRAPLASPTFTGTPKAPTASDALQHDTQLATTEFVAKAFESRLMNEIYIMSDPGTVSVPSSTEKIIKYTPAVSQYGHYWGSAYVPFQQNAAGRRAVRVERVHNNVAQLISSQDVRTAVSGTTTEVIVPFVTYLDPGDTIQVVVWQNSGSSLNINSPRVRALGFNRYVE